MTPARGTRNLIFVPGAVTPTDAQVIDYLDAAVEGGVTRRAGR